MNESHAGVVVGHFKDDTTTNKVLQACLWWSSLHKYYQDQV